MLDLAFSNALSHDCIQDESMSLITRNYQSSDRPEIEHMVLNAENFGEALLFHERLKLDVFEAFPRYGRVVVAEDCERHQVVGYETIFFEWKALVISSIITHQDHLRRGVGSALIERVKEIASDRPSTDVIRVDTGHFMGYAQAFYASCGFEQVACVPHYLRWNSRQIIFAYHVKR